MGDCLSTAIPFLILFFMAMVLTGKLPTRSYLIATLLFLPRMAKAAPWQSLMPVEPQDIASYLIQEMLRKVREKLKREALFRVEQMKKAFSASPAPNLWFTWGLTALLLLVSLTPTYALAPSSQEASNHLSPHQEEVAFCDQASPTEILKGTMNGTLFGRITRTHPHKQILGSLMHCLVMAHRPHGGDEDKEHNCLNITFDNQ